MTNRTTASPACTATGAASAQGVGDVHTRRADQTLGWPQQRCSGGATDVSAANDPQRRKLVERRRDTGRHAMRRIDHTDGLDRLRYEFSDFVRWFDFLRSNQRQFHAPAGRGDRREGWIFVLLFDLEHLQSEFF